MDLLDLRNNLHSNSKSQWICDQSTNLFKVYVWMFGSTKSEMSADGDGRHSTHAIPFHELAHMSELVKVESVCEGAYVRVWLCVSVDSIARKSR